MFPVSSWCCLCPIHWSQVLSWEWRCSWSSADRWCSNYIWVIKIFIASYIRDFTVNNWTCQGTIPTDLLSQLHNDLLDTFIKLNLGVGLLFFNCVLYVSVRVRQPSKQTVNLKPKRASVKVCWKGTGHDNLVTITGVTILVPYLSIKSLEEKHP